MKTASPVQRFGRRRQSLLALLGLPIALGTAHCGTSTTSDPTGTSGGSGGSGGSAGTGGRGGASGSGDAASDIGGPETGEGRDVVVTADSTTDRTPSDGTIGGCGYPTPPDPSCYVAGSPPPTTFGRCTRPPRGIKDVMGETFRWRNGVFYWVNGSNVVRLNGSTVEAVTSSGDVAGFFEVDDDAVYYLATADAGLSIRRTKLDRSSTVTVAPDVRGIFALNGDRIYFDASDGRFVSTSKLGGGSIDPVAGPPSVEQIFTNNGALIDATHLYWNEGTAPNVTLLRVAKGTNNIETVATHLPGPAALLQGDSVLLVAERKHILELPKSGGCPLGLVSSSVSSPASNVTAMAADETSIYWASIYGSDTNDLLLYRAPRRGGAVIEVIGWNSGVRAWSAPMLTPVLTPTEVLMRGEGLGVTVFALSLIHI